MRYLQQFCYVYNMKVAQPKMRRSPPVGAVFLIGGALPVNAL